MTSTVPELHSLGSDHSVVDLLEMAREVASTDIGRARSLVQQARVMARSRHDEHGEAEALYRATLEMEERLVGVHNVQLAATLVKLGSILQSQSRRGEAAVLFRRCSDLVSR